MGEKPNNPKEAEEKLTCLLESLGHGLEVLQGVEESLTRILAIFNHDLKILKGTVKESEPN